MSKAGGARCLYSVPAVSTTLALVLARAGHQVSLCVTTPTWPQRWQACVRMRGIFPASCCLRTCASWAATTVAPAADFGRGGTCATRGVFTRLAAAALRRRRG